MNEIITEYDQTEYWSQKHPCIFIDDERLDILIDELKPNQKYLGLIPTLFSALCDDQEVDLVWSRVLPDKEPSILPLLMCPDDVDLSCTLIVTKVTTTENTVLWHNFGVDQSCDEEELYPEYLGTTVEWFTENLIYEFPKELYLKMLEVFKQEIQDFKNQPNTSPFMNNQDSIHSEIVSKDELIFSKQHSNHFLPSLYIGALISTSTGLNLLFRNFQDFKVHMFFISLFIVGIIMLAYGLKQKKDNI